MLDVKFMEPKQVLVQTFSSYMFSAGGKNMFGFVLRNDAAQGLNRILAIRRSEF